MVESASDDKPIPVAVGFAPTASQRRATIAFRFVLVIPHYILLLLLIGAAFAVTIVAWFAALFLEEVPERIHRFLAGVVRYTTRVHAYMWMLTDKYPPFTLGASDYPVSVEVTPASLSGAAVFFRVILIIPALVVVTFVGAGMYVAGLFIWLVALISGRMPRTAFEAVAATVRYQARCSAYWMLLTPTYPGGLFGDRPVETPPAPDELAPLEPIDEPPPLATKLMLSKPGKRLVVAFLVIGGLMTAGRVAWARQTAQERVDRNAAVRQLNSANAELTIALRRFKASKTACATQPIVLACLKDVNTLFGLGLEIFANEVGKIHFPSSSAANGSRVQADARVLAASLQQMGMAPTPKVYQKLLADYQPEAAKFDQDNKTLIQGL